MKISLTGGDFQSRSVIASSQRTLNLYAENLPKDLEEPALVTHYPTPGLTKIGATPNGQPLRGLYRASNGDLYGVAGFNVYYIDKNFAFTLVGTMTDTGHVLNPTKMADNGVTAILCDGTKVNGYGINMATRSGLLPLYNPAASDAETASSTGWLGSTFVDFSDGYLIANSIGTPSFYISNAEDVIFDPLQFAGKTAYPDAVVAAVVQHRVIWVIGTLTTEVWFNSGGDGGANNFPFQIMPGVAIDWGCAAPYSIAKAETTIFWLAQNLNGETVVLQGSGYTIKRVSTHAVEHTFSTYAATDDAIGYAYMQNGHSFYVLNFPTADKTWVFDLATDQWHERCWLDDDGGEHRHRSTLHAFAYGRNIVNDWETGNLYELDLKVFTDNNRQIKRLISFPRQVDNENGNRVLFRSFQAEMSFGESLFVNDEPTLILQWSDDKGKTWSNGMQQSIGRAGEFNITVNWNRLGMSRNRVFRLEWAANALVALQGAFVDIVLAGS